jgi:acetolactate synthase small subunit
VSSLLARRGFNIHSLAVGPSHEEGMSKMTIVVDAPELEQVKKQLHKLVNVVRITELESDNSIEREIMLVRVSAAPGRRSDVLEVASIFKASPSTWDTARSVSRFRASLPNSTTSSNWFDPTA